MSFERQVLLEGRSSLVLFPQAFADTADAWLHTLDTTTDWRQDAITLYGKRHPIPRRQAWVADAGCTYRYSGMTLQPLPWTPLLATVRDRVAALAGRTFNAVLLNRYANGHDRMGWHRDNEPELGPCPVVAIVSLGAVRELAIRRGPGGRARAMPLPHGSLLVMGGHFQQEWQHALPERKRIRSVRISLTFRCVNPVA